MTNKSNKKERDDIISAENRIITRTPTYETNEKKKQQIKKFMASDNKPIQIKREKGNNLKVYCSTVAFEAVRQIPKRKKILDTNYTTNKTQTKGRTGKIVSEVVRVVQKQPRRNEAIFTANTCRTKVVS